MYNGVFLHITYTHRPIYFKLSLDYLEYLIQGKRYVNSCYPILLQNNDKKNVSTCFIQMQGCFPCFLFSNIFHLWMVEWRMWNPQIQRAAVCTMCTAKCLMFSFTFLTTYKLGPSEVDQLALNHTSQDLERKCPFLQKLKLFKDPPSTPGMCRYKDGKAR